MAQVAPPTKLALQSIQVNENLSKYPQTHYGIPKSDNDFAASRDSLRDRERGITTNSFVTENQKVTLIIPPQQRNLVPDETIIRFKFKVANWLPQFRMGGSIQRFIRTMIIRDGRGTVLEQIHDYNQIAQRLIDVHIPERVQENLMQVEGIYPSYKTYESQIPQYFKGPSTGSTTAALINNGVQPVPSINEELNRPWTGEVQIGDTIVLLDKSPIGIDSEQISSKTFNSVVPTGTFTIDPSQGDADIMVWPRRLFTPYYRDISSKLLAKDGANLPIEEVTLTFQPTASGLLTSSKHIPLWVTKGLQIEMTLDTNQVIFEAPQRDTSLPNQGFPAIQITQADVLYTAVTLTPVMQSALESQYHRRGLNLLVPVFHIDIRNVGTTTTIQEDYYNSFAMLNRIYQCCRDQSNIDDQAQDSLKLIRLNPTRRYMEYNRIYMPHWGNDNDLAPIDHYLEARKGINLLGDKKLELISFADFNSNGYDRDAYPSTVRDQQGYQTTKEIFVTNLETEPSGFLTGVDTNNGTIRLRIETASTVGKNLQVIFMAFKMITFQDGSPPLVQE